MKIDDTVRTMAEGKMLVVEPISVSVAEAAKLLGISERKARDLVNRADFPKWQAERGGRVLIPYRALREWVEAQVCPEGAR